MFWTFVAALLFVSIVLPLLFYLGILSLPVWGAIFSSIKENKQTISQKSKSSGKILLWIIIFFYTISLPESDENFKEFLGWVLVSPIIWFIYKGIRYNIHITKINKQKRLDSESTSTSQ